MPATTSQSSTATYIADCLISTVWYGEQLVKDIPADKFGHMPHPNLNHPAFCIGHLSLYPNHAFRLMERIDVIVEKNGYMELFQFGVECVEQDGRYPAKDELVEYYLDRYRKAAEILPGTSDNVFARPTPDDWRLQKVFPTVGSAVNFFLNNHHMTHLGQISAWRRTVGLGPVM